MFSSDVQSGLPHTIHARVYTTRTREQRPTHPRAIANRNSATPPRFYFCYTFRTILLTVRWSLTDRIPVTLACGIIGGTKAQRAVTHSGSTVGAATSYGMTAERASAIVKSLLDSISGMIQNIQSYDMALKSCASAFFFGLWFFSGSNYCQCDKHNKVTLQSHLIFNIYYWLIDYLSIKYIKLYAFVYYKKSNNWIFFILIIEF